MLRAPCLEPPLHGPQKAVGIAIGMLALQLVEELPARPPRLLVEPDVQLLAHRRERVGAPTPALRLGLRLRGRPHLARLPGRPQPRTGTPRATGRRRRARRRLASAMSTSRCWAARMSRSRRTGSSVAATAREPIAHRLGRSRVRQQPLAGRGRRVVALAHPGAVALLLRQLERGLEEVHEQPHRRIELRQHRARPRGPRAAGSRRSAAPPRRSSARPRPGRSCGRAGTA